MHFTKEVREVKIQLVLKKNTMHSDLMQCPALKLYRVELLSVCILAPAIKGRAVSFKLLLLFIYFYYCKEKAVICKGVDSGAILQQLRNSNLMLSWRNPSHAIVNIVRGTVWLPGPYLAGGSGLWRPWGAMRVFTIPTGLISRKEEAALTWDW